MNAKDEYGATLLHSSVESDAKAKDITKLLIDNGADINAKDDQGATVLHHAAQGRDLGVVRLLLERH